MQKINVTLNASTTNGSSRGSFTVAIEEQLPESLPKEQLEEKINNLMESARKSIEAQARNPTIDCKPISMLSSGDLISAENFKKPFVKKKFHEYQANNKSSTEPPTPGQIKYINDLATKDNLPVDVYLQRLGHLPLSELNKKECISILNKVVDAP